MKMRRKKQTSDREEGKTAQRKAHKTPFTSVKNRQHGVSAPFLYFHCGNPVRPLPLYFVVVINSESFAVLISSSRVFFPRSKRIIFFSRATIVVSFAYSTFTALTRSLTNPYFCRKTIPKDDYLFISFRRRDCVGKEILFFCGSLERIRRCEDRGNK